MSSNVKELVHEWEEAGRIGRNRPATRKQAINLAVVVALRTAARGCRMRNH